MSEYTWPMIYEFVIAFFNGFITYHIGKRYREKRNKVIQNIFLFTFFLALANLFAAVSRIIRIVTWQETAGARNFEGLVFAVIFIAISNIFLLQFGLAIFHPDLEKQKKLLIITVFAALTIVFIIYTLLTGMYTVDLTTGIWIFLVILALIVDLYIFIGSFRMIRRLSDRVDKAFVLMILFTPIFLVFVYIFFFLDILEGGNFTIFYYFGWLMGVIAAISMYFGVLRPKFLENRLKK